MKLNLDPLQDEILFDDVSVACATLQYYLTLFYLKMRDVDRYSESQARTMMMILFDQIIDNGESSIQRVQNRYKKNNDDKEQNQ